MTDRAGRCPQWGGGELNPYRLLPPGPRALWLDNFGCPTRTKFNQASTLAQELVGYGGASEHPVGLLSQHLVHLELLSQQMYASVVRGGGVPEKRRQVGVRGVSEADGRPRRCHG